MKVKKNGNTGVKTVKTKVKQVIIPKTENKAEILLIKLYYTVVSILLGYNSYTRLEEYIKKIKYEIHVNGNDTINIKNVMNALIKLGIFNFGFFFLDLDSIQQVILDTINVLKHKNNTQELEHLSNELTKRYIILTFSRLAFKKN